MVIKDLIENTGMVKLFLGPGDERRGDLKAFSTYRF